MALTNLDMLEGLRASRRHFLKHLKGLPEAAWDFKPYPECKSITETLAHLVVDDRAALQALQSNGEPDYEGLSAAMEGKRDRAELLCLLEESHEQLCSFIAERFGNEPTDAPASIWGSEMKAGRGIAFLSSEDFYHAGQVAFLRMAQDPHWDYYGTIYGPE